MFCTNCGAQCADNAKFCTHCGHKLNIPAQPAQPAGPAAAPAAPAVTPAPAAETPAPAPEAAAPAAVPEANTPAAAPEAPAVAESVPAESAPVEPQTAAPAASEPSTEPTVGASAAAPAAEPGTAPAAATPETPDMNATTTVPPLAAEEPTVAMPQVNTPAAPTQPIPAAGMPQYGAAPGQPVAGQPVPGQPAAPVTPGQPVAGQQFTMPTQQFAVPGQPAAGHPFQAAPGQPVVGQPAAPVTPGQPMAAAPGAPAQPQYAAPGTPGAPGAPTMPVAPGMPGAPVAPPRQHNPELDRLGADLKAAPAWQTIGVSLGIGMAAAVVAALISAAALLGIVSQAAASALSSMPGVGSISGMFSQVEVAAPNFIQLAIMMLTLTSAGSLSASAAAQGFGASASGAMSMSIGLGLAGAALFVGTAFGAFWFARRHAVRFRWTGAVSSVIVAALAGIVYVLLALIGRASLGAGDSGFGASAVLSGATFGTFISAFFAAGLGAAAGYFLASAAPDGSNVFLGFWRWLHRARGFVRTVTEAALVYAALYTVLLIVVLVAVAAIGRQPAVILLFPLVFPWLGSWIMTLTSFGGISAGYGMSAGTTVSMFSPGMAGQWILWIGVALFLVATFYAALRLSARTMYDPSKGGWANSWKSPLAAGVIWLVLTVLFCGVRASTGSAAAADVRPALWTFLVIALWTFVMEVIANTFGPHLVAPLWKIVAGGCVQPPLVWAQATAAAQTTAGAQTTAAAMPAAQTMPAPGVQPGVAGVAGAAPVAAQPSAQPAAPTAMPPTGMPPATPAAVPPRQPMSASTKRGLIIGSAVAGVLILLAVVWGVLGSTVFSARHAADTYVQAIAAGDYDRANELANPQVDKSKSKLLTSKAAKGENATIANARVTNVTTANGQTTASITYTLGGREHSANLSVAATGSKFLLFKDWTVTTPLVKTLAVSVPDAIHSVTVNGIEVSTDDAVTVTDSGMAFAVYPGTYRVAAPESKLYTSKETPITVTEDMHNSGEGFRSIPVTATSALKDAINDQVHSKLDTCAQSNEAAPDGCPFGFPYMAEDDDYRNFAWSINSYPKVRHVDLSGTFETSSFKAKATYERQDWFDDTWEPDDQEQTFYVQGKFRIDGDTVKVTHIE